MFLDKQREEKVPEDGYSKGLITGWLEGYKKGYKKGYNELRKDKERLDWLLGYEMDLILYGDTPLETRENIDKAMEESQ